MKNKILVLVILFLFNGCKNEDKTPDIKAVLSEVTTKFPQLPKGELEHYQLEKSVENGKYNYKIQLYSEARNIKDPQKILVFINAKKECYAIPFFSNTYRDYWEFKNEIPLPKIKKVQSTFTKEYFHALKALKLNKIEVYFSITNDILISILNCNEITSCEFADVKKIIFHNSNSSLDPENNYDYLKQKWAKNDEEILKTVNCIIDDKDVQRCIGYLDYANYRFYQLVLKDEVLNADKNPQKIITSENELQIVCYRKDQIVSHMIIL